MLPRRHSRTGISHPYQNEKKETRAVEGKLLNQGWKLARIPGMDLDRIVVFIRTRLGTLRAAASYVSAGIRSDLVQEESSSSTTCVFPSKRRGRRRGLIGLLCMTTGCDHKSPSPQPVIRFTGPTVSQPKANQLAWDFATVLARQFRDGIVFGRCPILSSCGESFWPTNMHGARYRACEE